MTRTFALVLATATIACTAAAQRPTVTFAPREAEPGGIVRITLTLGGDAASVAGSMAGEPLQFLRSDAGVYRAIAGVPVEASDSARAFVTVSRRGGTDTLYAWVKVPHVEPVKEEAPLAVSTEFTRPLDARTQQRIADENARARAVGRRSHDKPPMWSEPFEVPRDAKITSNFGTGRMFNGTVASRHFGVDFRGDTGAPVHAANRGVVALVDTFFLAGRIIYLDHGGGVVTGYFHLSKPLVAKGDTVEKGERIGLVGATGRVTGPHLHWSARYGTLAVNPLALIAIPVSEYSSRISPR